MTTHAMIDIETLDTAPTSVVLSVGAVKFDPFKQEPHTKTLWRPNIDEQVKLGRTMSDDTLRWWSQQEKHIQDTTFSDDNRITVEQLFKNLNKYLVGVDRIWAHGPQFDMVIIEDLYAQHNHHRGWAYWQIMDSRTLFNIMPVDPRKGVQQNLHSADDDAYWQAVCVQEAYKFFNVDQSWGR